MQRNKQVAMGRKKFNMDPKKVYNMSVIIFLGPCDGHFEFKVYSNCLSIWFCVCVCVLKLYFFFSFYIHIHNLTCKPQ